MSNTRQEQVEVRGVVGNGRNFLDQPGQHNAFLGFSLDKTISDRHLGLYIEWAVNQARHCYIIIDDIEPRHNYMVFRGIDEEESKTLALSRGLELTSRIAGTVASARYPYREVSYIQTHPDDHNGHVIYGLSRVSERFPGDRILNPLVQEYAENDIFRQDVDLQVERGLGNRLVVWSSHVSEAEYKLSRKRLAQFVLEETAVTIDLVQRQYEVELYAGPPIQIAVDLFDPTTNKYPRLRERLDTTQNYGHVHLGIKRT